MFQRLPEQPVCPDDDALGHLWVKSVHKNMTVAVFCENCYITPSRILENQIFGTTGANESEGQGHGESQDTRGALH
jgi:hypothetical protein